MKTYNQFLSAAATRSMRDGQKMGTAFIDELYFSGRSLLADALAVSKSDPFGKKSVPLEALDFVKRNW